MSKGIVQKDDRSSKGNAMTKSRGIGRGGARPNSGPKRKVASVPSSPADSGDQAPAPIAPRTVAVTSELVTRDAQGGINYSQTAINVLLEVSLSGSKESARVTAARDILRHQRDVDPLGYVKARADAKKRNADIAPELVPPDEPDLVEDKLAKLLN